MDFQKETVVPPGVDDLRLHLAHGLLLSSTRLRHTVAERRASELEMKTLIRKGQLTRGITLLEAVGTLCVVVTLAAIIVPRVFTAIDDAKLGADIVSINSVLTASQNYYKMYNRIGLASGAPISVWNNKAYEQWDRSVLLREQFLEQGFASKLASNGYVRVIQANTTTVVDPLATGTYGSLGSQFCNNGAYDLLRAYAAASPPEDGFSSPNAYAFVSRPYAWPSVNLGGLSLPTLRLPSALPAVFGARHTVVSRLSTVRWLAARAVAPMRFAVSRGKSLLMRLLPGSGIAPLEGSITFVPRWSVPSDWSPPSPGPGSYSPPSPPGTGSGDTSHTNSPLPFNNVTAPASTVVEVVLQGVTVSDAYRLSLAIDGPTRSNWAFWDSQGRVKYDFANARQGNVFIYITSDK